MTTKDPRTANIEISDPEFPNEIRQVDDAEVLYHLHQANGSELLLLQTQPKWNPDASVEGLAINPQHKIGTVEPILVDGEVEGFNFIAGAVKKYGHIDNYKTDLIRYIKQQLKLDEEKTD